MSDIRFKVPVCPMSEEHGCMRPIEYRREHGLRDWHFIIGEEVTMLFACRECGHVIAREINKLEKLNGST